MLIVFLMTATLDDVYSVCPCFVPIGSIPGSWSCLLGLSTQRCTSSSLSCGLTNRTSWVSNRHWGRHWKPLRGCGFCYSRVERTRTEEASANRGGRPWRCQSCEDWALTCLSGHIRPWKWGLQASRAANGRRKNYWTIWMSLVSPVRHNRRQENWLIP